MRVEFQAFHDVEPEWIGLVVLNEGGGAAIVRDDVDAHNLQQFCSEFASRIERVIEHGPEPDGWHYRPHDGGWELWAKACQDPNCPLRLDDPEPPPLD